MHHHTHFAAALAGLFTLAQPSFALPTTTADALIYARQTAPTASHIEAPGLQVQGQADQAAPAVYEGKYKGTSFYTDSDCSSPRYIPLEPATLLRQHRSLVCDGRGHLHHMDPLHLSFTLPAATSVSKQHTGHKHEGAHKPSMKKLQDTQFDTCMRSCLTTPTCMSFSFNAWDRVCNLYSVSLAQQDFIDWREQEADPADNASHAVWSDVAFWDADCFVRVCSAYEGESEEQLPSPKETASDNVENATSTGKVVEAEQEEAWMLGERLEELNKPKVEAVIEVVVDERRVSRPN